MKNTSIKTVVAIGIGAALVGLSNILDREGGENLSGSSPMKRTHGTGVAPTLVGS